MISEKMYTRIELIILYININIIIYHNITLYDKKIEIYSKFQKA